LAFPTTRVGPFKNSETEIEITARGFRLATSVGGTLTGRGGRHHRHSTIREAGRRLVGSFRCAVLDEVASASLPKN
jgi:pyruvate dehydrogenase complex dehydrogenase (E1) component